MSNKSLPYYNYAILDMLEKIFLKIAGLPFNTVVEDNKGR